MRVVLAQIDLRYADTPKREDVLRPCILGLRQPRMLSLPLSPILVVRLRSPEPLKIEENHGIVVDHCVQVYIPVLLHRISVEESPRAGVVVPQAVVTHTRCGFRSRRPRNPARVQRFARRSPDAGAAAAAKKSRREFSAREPSARACSSGVGAADHHAFSMAIFAAKGRINFAANQPRRLRQ